MAPRAPLQFDGFTLDLDDERLLKDGAVVPLTPKAFALLAHLASRPGRLVLKDELLDAVWGRRFVSEGTIKSLLAELRAALGDDARAPRWVQTVPRRGLRFIGRLQPPSVADTPPAPAAAAAGPAPIGRERELQALLDALATQRLVTLTGPAGVGKTCLAHAVAEAMARQGPVWWVELAPLAPADADAAALRSVLAAAMRLAGGAGAADDTLAAAAAALQGLLVLDNAEHLLDGLAPLVARVLRQAAGLRVLVTSREPLKIGAEQQLRLAPLPVPTPADDADPVQVRACASVRLFSARVAAQLPGFVLGDGQCAAVARVCRALDGLPLALEMAAARVPVLGVGGLADHLLADDAAGGGALALLTQGARDLAPHQRTLRASIAWSHALLSDPQRRVLRRLAVFRGGFTLESACVVCADVELDAAQVIDAVQALLDKSLVGPGVQPPGAEQRRFQLLESVREFAAEQLQAAGEGDATARAHVQAMQVLWSRADDVALDVPAMAWHDQQALELDNLRAALRHSRDGARAGNAALAAALALLAGSAHLLWLRHALPLEGQGWCDAASEAAATLPGTVPDEALARVDLARAGIAFIYRTLSMSDGLAAALRAVVVFQRQGDVRRLFHAHALAASLLGDMGQADRGDRDHLPAMQALAQPGWSRLRLRFLRNAEGMAARRRGDLARFRALAHEEWTVSREHGAAGEAWTAAYTLAVAEALAGAPDSALALTRTVVPEVLAAGRQQQYGQLLSLHALLSARHSAPQAAREVFAITTPLIPLMGACEIQWLALAWLAWREGRAGDAAGLLGWFESPALGASSRYGDGTYIGSQRVALAALLAQQLGEDGAAAARRAGHDWGAAPALAIGLKLPPARSGAA